MKSSKALILGKKTHWRLVFIAVLVGDMFGCGTDTTFSEGLVIRMYGALAAPSGAEGAHEPMWQEYTLTGVTLTEADTSEGLALMDTGETLEVRIVSSSQIVFTKDMSDYVGTTYANAVFDFDPEVLGASRYKDDHTLTLDTPRAIFDTEFTIETGTDVELSIEVGWRNTVSRDESTDPPTETMIAPSFSVIRKN